MSRAEERKWGVVSCEAAEHWGWLARFMSAKSAISVISRPGDGERRGPAKLSKLLNQEDALSALCSRGDFQAPQERPSRDTPRLAP